MSHGSARILVVDDEPVQAEILRRWLIARGHSDIRLAANGEDALERLAAEAFDLVLCDVKMPKMDGRNLLLALQGSGRLAHLPVIMVTGVTQTDMMIDCIAIGAEDYIPKPVNATLLESRISSVLEKKRLQDSIKQAHDRMEAELEEARTRQEAILPEPLDRDGVFQTFGRMQAARAIGGDFYDFFLRDEDTLFLAVGDVTGKGPGAALFMTQMVRLIRLIAKHWSDDDGPPSPAQIVRIVNDEITQLGETAQLVTLHLCRIALSTGQVRFCDAGHGLAWRLREGGEVEPIELVGGPPIGAVREFAFEEGVYDLSPRDAILFITDGAPDATDEVGEMFGHDRLAYILGAIRSLAPEAIVDGVFNAVNAFIDGVESPDDITALAFRRL